MNGHQLIMKHYLPCVNGSEQIKGQTENLIVTGVNRLFESTSLISST